MLNTQNLLVLQINEKLEQCNMCFEAQYSRIYILVQLTGNQNQSLYPKVYCLNTTTNAPDRHTNLKEQSWVNFVTETLVPVWGAVCQNSQYLQPII